MSKSLPPFLRELTLRQIQYLKDDHRFTVVTSGRRSRKTLLSKRKLLIKALETPGRYFQAAPTRPQVKDIFWEDLKRDTELFRVGNPIETELSVRLINGSYIRLFGLDAPSRIEGHPWDGGHITEMGNVKPDAWPEHIRPLFSDTNGWCILEGVPEGKNHFHDHALYACGGVIPTTKPIIGGYGDNPQDSDWAYFHWFSSDVLPAKEIEAARRQLDERTFRQEYEGSFESYEGQLYYTFDSLAHVGDFPADPQRMLYLTCDFNKSPMVWSVAQYDGHKLTYVDQVASEFNAKTKLNAIKFCDQFKNHVIKVVTLVGDAANAHESIRDQTTDFIIIKEVLKSRGWRVIDRVAKSNPSINNRVNIACSKFEKGCIEADRKCTYLILDWERNESDGRGGKDKSDKKQTHGSDGGDYLHCFLWYDEFYSRAVRSVSRW